MYTTMTCGQLSKNAQFADFAALTQAVASKDFDADTAAAVQKAWGDVGVVATQPAASGSSDAGTASGTSGAGTATAM